MTKLLAHVILCILWIPQIVLLQSSDFFHKFTVCRKLVSASSSLLTKGINHTVLFECRSLPFNSTTDFLKKKKKSSKNISQNILQTKLKLYIAIHSVQFVNVKYNVNINVSLFRFFKFIFMNSCLFAGIFPQSLLLNNNSFFFFS